jgi:hypothetical protein
MISEEFENKDIDMLAYLKNHTGGSIRHKNITAIECQRALFDLDRDWQTAYGEMKGLMKSYKKAFENLKLDKK